jgi:hypothetical protein
MGMTIFHDHEEFLVRADRKVFAIMKGYASRSELVPLSWTVGPGMISEIGAVGSAPPKSDRRKSSGESFHSRHDMQSYDYDE